MPSAILHGLNPPQRSAVAHGDGPLLVLAGAGTGKTRVITHRIAQLIADGVPAESILSVTFTNKAAKEMRQRTRQLLGEQGLSRRAKPVLQTFHKLCLDVLREDIVHLGYPRRFTIADQGDQMSLARAALREIRVPEKLLKADQLLWEISAWKTAGIKPDRAAASVDDDRQQLAAMGYRRYQQKLKTTATVDFDDILVLTDELFRTHPETLAKHQERFRFIQVDEYQDTSALQFEIVSALAAPHRNLAVVGDDDQSIYGWRGADVSHILRFPIQYDDAAVVRLEDNYRCTAPILDAANRLVARNADRHKKTLRAAKASTDEVSFREYPDEATEAMEIAREIRFWHEAKGVPLADFAILFRTNEQPRPFEAELRKAKLRYVLLGAKSFFERREVKDVLAYLQAANNTKDEASLLRIINRPARGLGDKTVQTVLERSVRDDCSLWDAVQVSLDESQIAPREAAAFERFRELMGQLRDVVEDRSLRLSKRIESVIAAIDYESELEKTYTDPEQRAARRGMLEQLKSTADDFDSGSGSATMGAFLRTVALDGRELSDDRDQMAKEDAIRMMTLHSAKGLEFPRVYLVGLEEGILPHRRSIETGTIDEERRLAYVGVTRAMDRLTVSFAAARKKWGKMRKSLPSRFLAEMREQ